MPQADSDAGIGFALSQAPLAYSKKSTPGSTEVSMCAARKSACAGAVAGAAAPVDCVATPSAASAGVPRHAVMAAASSARRKERRTGRMRFPGVAPAWRERPPRCLPGAPRVKRWKSRAPDCRRSSPVELEVDGEDDQGDGDE